MRLPRTSLTDPAMSWPSERPSMQAVRLICASEVVVWRSPAMTGSAGRYISRESGPKDASKPSTSTIHNRLPLVISFDCEAIDMRDHKLSYVIHLTYHWDRLFV
ncbi:hypothetical protein D3C85_1068030 [compost metagenome]